MLLLTDDMQLISVDDHIIEPPSLWQDRVPEKHQAMAPRIVEVDGGTQQWCFEGKVDGMTGLSAVAGTDLKTRGLEPRRFDDMRPGYYDPVERLKDLDIDGVHAEVLFPNYARFAGTRFFHASDKELALICVEAYNDFVLEEWQATAPDRLCPLVILPIWDVRLCVQELQRVAARGARAITFPDNPTPLGLPSFHTDHWSRLFSAIEEVDMAVCMHFGTSGRMPIISEDAPLAVQTTLMGSTLFQSMTDLVFSPVLHEHPTVKICYSEGGIGWLPFALQRVDQVWEHYRFYNLERTINAEVRPSDLIRRNIYGCFIDDPLGVELRHLIGVDRILWEADYPHADSLWPNSRTNAAKVMADVPDDEVRAMVESNARRVFKL